MSEFLSELNSSDLVLSLFLLLFELQPQTELLQRRAVQRVLSALELDDLVEDGPQLVQQGLDTTQTQKPD